MPIPPDPGTYQPVTYSCGGCDTRWPGVNRAHCSACHRTFSGPDLFDKHRRDRHGTGICVDPETIIVKAKDTGVESRAMFLTGGIWHGVETPKPRGQNLRKERA